VLKLGNVAGVGCEANDGGGDDRLLMAPLPSPAAGPVGVNVLAPFGLGEDARCGGGAVDPVGSIFVDMGDCARILAGGDLGGTPPGAAPVEPPELEEWCGPEGGGGPYLGDAPALPPGNEAVGLIGGLLEGDVVTLGPPPGRSLGPPPPGVVNRCAGDLLTSSYVDARELPLRCGGGTFGFEPGGALAKGEGCEAPKASGTGICLSLSRSLSRSVERGRPRICIRSRSLSLSNSLCSLSLTSGSPGNILSCPLCPPFEDEGGGGPCCWCWLCSR
jgi:hypothetical protein